MTEYRRPKTTKTLSFPGGLSFDVESGDVDALNAGQELAQRLQSTDLSELGTDAYMTLCKEIMAAIDTILGKGASAKINKGQRVNIIHLVSQLAFVMKEVNAGFRSSVDAMLADLTETVVED